MGGRPVWSRTAPGPLEPCAVGYARWLAEQGFSGSRIERRVDQLGHLSHWLAIEGLGPDELTAEHQLRFSEARDAAGYRTWVSPRSLRVPLAYLREAGVVSAPAAVVPEGPVERLLDDYRRYLAGERGLVAHTIENHERVARLFLAGREQLGAGLGLEHLAAQDVSAFLASECPKRSVSGARDLIKGLRGLLRYLHVAGVIPMPLQWAVPTVAFRRDHNLPLGLSRSEVARLLASCDRRRTVGRRDYAVLLLLARLGLRAGEVAAIELEDIDWRRGEFRVRGKGARLEMLPLPVEVGEAIVSVSATPSTAGQIAGSVSARPRSVLPADWQARSRGSCIARAFAPSCRWFTLTGCGIPPRPSCCARAGRCRRSRRCCDTASSRPRRSTPKSTAARCGNSRGHGREVRHELAPRRGQWLSGDPSQASATSSTATS